MAHVYSVLVHDILLLPCCLAAVAFGRCHCAIVVLLLPFCRCQFTFSTLPLSPFGRSRFAIVVLLLPCCLFAVALHCAFLPLPFCHCHFAVVRLPLCRCHFPLPICLFVISMGPFCRCRFCQCRFAVTILPRLFSYRPNRGPYFPAYRLSLLSLRHRSSANYASPC